MVPRYDSPEFKPGDPYDPEKGLPVDWFHSPILADQLIAFIDKSLEDLKHTFLKEQKRITEKHPIAAIDEITVDGIYNHFEQLETTSDIVDENGLTDVFREEFDSYRNMVLKARQNKGLHHAAQSEIDRIICMNLFQLIRSLVLNPNVNPSLLHSLIDAQLALGSTRSMRHKMRDASNAKLLHVLVYVNNNGQHRRALEIASLVVPFSHSREFMRSLRQPRKITADPQSRIKSHLSEVANAVLGNRRVYALTFPEMRFYWRHRLPDDRRLETAQLNSGQRSEPHNLTTRTTLQNAIENLRAPSATQFFDNAGRSGQDADMHRADQSSPMIDNIVPNDNGPFLS